MQDFTQAEHIKRDIVASVNLCSSSLIDIWQQITLQNSMLIAELIVLVMEGHGQLELQILFTK